MKDKKVIVTGRLGFIGSHLVEALVKKNDVTVIDNQATGKAENIDQLGDARPEVIEGDVAALNLPETFDGYEYVFHLAAPRASSAASMNRCCRTSPTPREP